MSTAAGAPGRLSQALSSGCPERRRSRRAGAGGKSGPVTTRLGGSNRGGSTPTKVFANTTLCLRCFRSDLHMVFIPMRFKAMASFMPAKQLNPTKRPPHWQDAPGSGMPNAELTRVSGAGMFMTRLIPESCARSIAARAPKSATMTSGLGSTDARSFLTGPFQSLFSGTNGISPLASTFLSHDSDVSPPVSMGRSLPPSRSTCAFHLASWKSLVHTMTS
mmetsp:Transcript_126783/g.370614  ORF Transcript_126783/g.370614 Transcript_126783/m.370614 type:complete len:219 (+) Transcript_126783:764-1420(+)